MAEKITVYQCPACTGPLKFDGKIGKLKCEYCGSSYTTQEIEKLYAQKNESAAVADEEAQKKADQAEAEGSGAAAAGASAATGASGSLGSSGAGSGSSGAATASGAGSGWGSDAAHMRAYNCTTCGAELITDETTAATSCPYCGNPTIIPGKFAGMDRPDYVIPFKVDKKQAVNSFKDYYKGRLLLPRAFEADNHIEEIKGVYLPFWMFSGEVSGNAQYEAYKEDCRRTGDEEIVRKDHYDVYREGTMRFTRIPVDASTKMSDDLMDSIEPFEYKEMRPFAMEYMPGYLANKYDVTKEQSSKRADDRAVSTFRSALRETVKGYNSVNVNRQSEKIDTEKVEYGMLPVWLLSSEWEDKIYTFAMNGQSGKMVGDLPVSKPKLAVCVIGIFAVVFALMHFLILNQQGDSMLISIIAGLIVAAIAGFIMYSSMKPVAKSQSAGGYVSEGGSLRLTRNIDRFIRTTETRKRIQSQQDKGGPGGPGGKGGPGGHGGKGGPGGHGVPGR